MFNKDWPTERKDEVGQNNQTGYQDKEGQSQERCQPVAKEWGNKPWTCGKV